MEDQSPQEKKKSTAVMNRTFFLIKWKVTNGIKLNGIKQNGIKQNGIKLNEAALKRRVFTELKEYCTSDSAL